MNETPQPPFQPPSQPPAGKQCFNCGHTLVGGAAFCPHCGAPLPTQGSGFALVFRIIGCIILGGLTFILGAAGACFMLLGAGDIGGTGSESASFGLIGLALLGGAGACIWGLVVLLKKK